MKRNCHLIWCSLCLAVIACLWSFTAGETALKHRKLNSAAKKITNSSEFGETDADDDYNDYVDEAGNAKQNRTRNINIVKRIGITYAWGRWEKWSKCNNTCVQIKRRKCIERIQMNDTTLEATETTFYPDLDSHTGCFGIFKRFRMCKDEKCKTQAGQLRNEQCAGLNKEPYKGKFYNWIGYEKEHNECELYCRPRDSDIFRPMNKSVLDGAPCEKPAVYYTNAYRRKAVCVEGICRVSYYVKLN